MKKLLVAATAVIASISSASAFAENFKGPYVGLLAGVNAFQSGSREAVPGAGAQIANSGATLFNWGLYGGYGYTFGQFYTGGELNFTMSSGESKGGIKSNTGVSTASFHVKQPYSMSPAIRLGALIAPKTLAFVKMGAVGSQFKAAVLGNNDNTTQYKKTVWGYSFGAGLETLVTNNISVRLDYTYNIYPTHKFSVNNGAGAAASTAKISPRDNIFRLGAAWNF